MQEGAGVTLISGEDSSSGFATGTFHAQGSSDLYRLSSGPAPRRLRVPANYLRLRGNLALAPETTAVNLVTDPDRNPKVLHAIGQLLKRHRGRVVNRPEAVLQSTRERVARRAATIDGLIAPPTIRLPAPPARAGASLRASPSPRSCSSPTCSARARWICD